MVNLHDRNIYANCFKSLGSKKLPVFGVMEPDEWPVVLSGEIAGADAKKKDTPKALLSHASQRGTFPFPLTGCSGNYILS